MHELRVDHECSTCGRPVNVRIEWDALRMALTFRFIHQGYGIQQTLSAAVLAEDTVTVDLALSSAVAKGATELLTKTRCA